MNVSYKVSFYHHGTMDLTGLDYMTVPQLPEESSGTTYSRLFGVNTGPLEHLLVKRDIMGPSWLKIDQAQISNTNGTRRRFLLSAK